MGGRSAVLRGELTNGARANRGGAEGTAVEATKPSSTGKAAP